MSRLNSRSAWLVLPAAVLLAAACSDPTSPYQAVSGDVQSSQAQTPITTCGTTISAPGHYGLTADLLNCPGNGITITASNVSIDLNGHHVAGVSVDQGLGIAIGIGVSGGVSAVNIEGPGSVENFRSGFALEQVRGSSVRRVTVRGNFFGMGLNAGFGVGQSARSTNNQVTGNTFDRNWAHGITMNGGDQNLITNNVFTNNGQIYGGHGVFMFVAANNTVTNNTITGQGEVGILIEGANVDGTSVGNVVRGNNVTGSGLDLQDDWGGCDHNTWSGNTFASSYPSCIR